MTDDNEYDDLTPPTNLSDYRDRLTTAWEVFGEVRGDLPPDGYLPKLTSSPPNIAPNVLLDDTRTEEVAAQVAALDLTNYHEPWGRLDHDTDKSWLYFKYFRDAGPARMLKSTAEHFGVGPLAMSTHARNHLWQSRVAAFDEWEDRQYQIRRIQGIRDMADRHSVRMVEALEALALPFNALTKKMADEPDLVAEMSDKDVKSLLTMAGQAGRIIPTMMAAERLARGMPTEITEQKSEITHVVELDTDRLASVLSELERAGAFNARLAESGVDEIVDAEIVEVHPGEEPEPD